MKLKIIPQLILLAVVFQSSFGQSEIDSLRDLTNAAQTDSARHANYQELTHAFLKINLDSALVYAEKAFEAAKKSGSESLLANSNYLIGSVLIRLKRPDQALPYCQKAKDFYLANNDSLKAMKAINAVGAAYSDMSQIPKAIEQYYIALRMAEQLANLSAACLISNNLAILEQLRGDFEKAIELYQKSLEIAESIDDPEVIMNTMNGLANSYIQSNNVDSAIAIRLRLIQLAKKTGDLRMEAIATNELAGDYLTMENYELALNAAFKAEQMCLEIGAIRNLSFNYSYQGQISEKLKNYPQAISSYQKALKLFEESSDLTNVSIVHKEIASLYEKSGGFELAYSHLKSHKIIGDSLSTIEKEEAIQEVKSKYETEKKEEENKLLTQKNEALKNERNLFLIIATTFFVFLGLLFFLFRKIIKQKKEIEKNNQLKDKFFAIIAHDLRSPLIALRGLAKKAVFLMNKNRMDDVKRMGDEVEEAVTSVHKLLDNLLAWALVNDSKFPYSPQLLQAQELVDEALKLYHETAEMKNIHFTTDALPGVQLYADRQAMATVLRNLVDNAIKFSEENGEVKIAVEQSNGHSLIYVKDSGKGIPTENLQHLFNNKPAYRTKGTLGEKGTGLGLVLCRELVEMNGGEISVTSDVGKGTAFKIVLPSKESRN